MDNLLQDKFLSFEGDIPMSDWNAIENRLNNKRRFAWLWWAALPLIIISGLGLYSVLTSPSAEKLSKITPLKNKIEKSESIIQTDNTPDNVVSEPRTEANDKKRKTTSTPNNTPSVKVKDLDITVTEPNVPQANFETINLVSKTVKDIWSFTLPMPELRKELELVKRGNNNPPFLSFEFGLNIAPAIGLDAIKKNSSRSNFIHRDFFGAINGTSSFGSGFNNGIHAQINFGKHWYLRQGIYISNYSVYHDYNHTIDSFPNVDMNPGSTRGIIGYSPLTPVTVKYSGKASVKYLSIPLMIGNRTYFTKKLGIEIKTGITLSRMLSASGQTVNPTYLTLEDINSNNTIRKWTTGLTFSAGLFYKPNKNLIFTVEPNYSTLLGSAQSKDYPVKNRYYNYGINLNVNYILIRK